MAFVHNLYWRRSNRHVETANAGKVIAIATAVAVVEAVVLVALVCVLFDASVLPAGHVSHNAHMMSWLCPGTLGKARPGPAPPRFPKHQEQHVLAEAQDALALEEAP